MTKSGKSKYPAAARVGINPTPTKAKCCNRFDNPLIAKLLHASAVGTGFIPVLPTTDKIQSKCPAATDKNKGSYPAAARVGINPTPTAVKCCKCLIISVLDRALDRVVAVINPRACVYGFFAGAALVALRRRINLIAVCRWLSTAIMDCCMRVGCVEM